MARAEHTATATFLTGILHDLGDIWPTILCSLAVVHAAILPTSNQPNAILCAMHMGNLLPYVLLSRLVDMHFYPSVCSDSLGSRL